ncbi:MAG: LuxR C-terminal-related transcriptional regulator [Nocardioidaceae bacterium]
MTRVLPGTALSMFGIDADNEQVYRLVLRNPGCTLEALADRTGQPVAEVDTYLEPLLEARLVRASGDGIFAEEPEFSLGRLLNDQARQLLEAEQALSSARAEIGTYLAEHLAGQRSDWRPISIDMIPSSELGDVMETLAANGRGELRFLRPDQWLLPTGKAFDEAVTKQISIGRGSRVIYPADIVESSASSVRARAQAGERIRVLPVVPARMAIFGYEAVVIPEAWSSNAGDRMLIRQPGIVAACTTLFEQLWDHALSVPGLGGEPAAKPNRQLLQLLARGMKDEYMARALGLSLRTVRRRIASLMAELGVDSRFQAGMEAVRRGWI